MTIVITPDDFKISLILCKKVVSGFRLKLSTPSESARQFCEELQTNLLFRRSPYGLILEDNRIVLRHNEELVRFRITNPNQYRELAAFCDSPSNHVVIRSNKGPGFYILSPSALSKLSIA